MPPLCKVQKTLYNDPLSLRAVIALGFRAKINTKGCCAARVHIAIIDTASSLILLDVSLTLSGAS